MLTTNDDLARTRQAFDAWRAKRQGRTRIPPQLWEKAVSLLAHHPITRVARELRLDPTKLRKRRLSVHQSGLPNSSPAPHFLEVRAAGLNSKSGPTLISDPSAPRLTTEAAWRLQIERADGHRLTLSVPSSEWSHIEALYSLFLQT